VGGIGGDGSVSAAMKTHVEFRSDRFPRMEDDGDEVNPGRWGRRLATFVHKALLVRGIQALEPYPEDWGWVVPIANNEFPLWIGCGNYDDYPDGFLCFIEPRTPVIRKWFRKIDTTVRVTAIRDALDAILTEDAGIRDKKWRDA
jgi:hypothetical protein